ncbi:unnamed protein product [Ostreobium quekettii]|uniref:Transcription factor IIIC subunit 5 HTH domain-containing protein n=1 Tax=Ostreobium quekettii TaxID=121088 RepID=A0A8S1J3C8_9CHLO|nr:unnamed protein product [Ostreobium quekettii]|eukprot:evm.model.scf_1410.2 EVM.evm.TU.scf_1410.2   scf_1410:21483-26019(+)
MYVGSHGEEPEIPGRAEPSATQSQQKETLEPMRVLPPLFSKVDYPLDYNYRDNAWRTRHKGKYWHARRISFYSTNIVPQANKLPQTDEDFLKHWNFFKKLFERRKIWSTAMLVDEAHGACDRDTVMSVIRRMCYRFRQGPWQGCWIELGYDPRIDSASRHYQSMTYILPKDWYLKARRKHLDRRQSKDAPGAMMSLNSFCHVPYARKTTLQLCDLKDDRIQSILNDDGQCSSTCRESTGWLADAAWTSIRDAIDSRFQALLNAETWEARTRAPTDAPVPAKHTAGDGQGQGTQPAVAATPPSDILASAIAELGGDVGEDLEGGSETEEGETDTQGGESEEDVDD